MLRIRHTGGEKVMKGNYWNFSTGDRVLMDSEGILPGDSAAVYYKANPAVILLAGPILGLVYAAFLPFIGLAMVLKLTVTRLFGGSFEGLSRVATFNWSPSVAYLAGRRAKKARKAERPAAGNDPGKAHKE